jgi:glycyl-tRNA synthetase beta subunit
MGKATSDILKDWIYELIPHLPFTKTMIWNESRMALARPLRWLCFSGMKKLSRWKLPV